MSRNDYLTTDARIRAAIRSRSFIERYFRLPSIHLTTAISAPLEALGARLAARRPRTRLGSRMVS